MLCGTPGAPRAHPGTTHNGRSMSDWVYVHNLDPVLVELGPLQVGWYGLMYALSFLAGYAYLNRAARWPDSPVPREEVPNLLTFIILGVVVGGRLGWVIFYGGMPYLLEPWRVLETWKGGMSFHGGMLGVVVALVWYARSRRLALLRLADHVALFVPVGLMLGRIGNFINGELYGAPTDGSWGVIFPGDPLQVPRHPSQLYEATLEGPALLLALVLVHRLRLGRTGLGAATFLLGYGLARFAVEFVRLPDAHLGYLWGFITMGQLLSLPMILVGLVWAGWLLARGAPSARPARKARS